MEREFEAILRTLQPSEDLLGMATDMFRELWDARLAASRSQAGSIRSELGDIERKVERLIDRVVEAEDSQLITGYE